MSIYHDEVEIEDFEYDDEEGVYYYPCPCGDRFEVTKVREFRIFIFAIEGYILMGSDVLCLCFAGGFDCR